MRGEAACASVNRMRILGVVKNYFFQSDREVIRPNVKEGDAFAHCSPQPKTKAKQNLKTFPRGGKLLEEIEEIGEIGEVAGRGPHSNCSTQSTPPTWMRDIYNVTRRERPRHKMIWERLRGAAGVQVYCPHRCEKTNSQLTGC